MEYLDVSCQKNVTLESVLQRIFRCCVNAVSATVLQTVEN